MILNWVHFSLFGLVLATGLSASRFARRDQENWLVDALSLTNHFALIPALQALAVYPLLSFLLPQAKGSLDFGWVGALGFNLLIDYAWYWNHRILHSKNWLWNLHAVHHSAEDLDVLASSRNALVTPLFMVYFWLIPVAIYLLRDPAPFLLVSGISLLINFWGHTRLNLPRGSVARRILSLAIIQPEDHFWHHSADHPHCNFGTVFNFWDRFHSTWHQPGYAPTKLGFHVNRPLWLKTLLPF